MINVKSVLNKTPVIILHGLFGSSENWMKIAKSLSGDYPIFSLDLRNHGKSSHHDSMTFEEMANDIFEIVTQLNFKKIHMIGHSLGGKVAMQFAKMHPTLIDKLVVVDILPIAYPDRHTKYIQAMESVNLKSESKNDINDQMKKEISDIGIRQFIMKNLSRTENGFKWDLNLSAIRKNYPNLTSEIKFENPINTTTLFIRGENSGYISLESYYELRDVFIDSHLETISGSGHWVHAEQPEQFLNRVQGFLNE